MRQIVCYFDVASPLAWLAFEQLPDALVGVSHWVDYRPVLRDRLRARHAGIARNPTATTVQEDVARAREIAAAADIAFSPPETPFDPRRLLHLLLARALPGTGPNRYVVERVMRHVWQADGTDPSTPERLSALGAALAPRCPVDSTDVAAELNAMSDAAAARRIADVPAFEVPSLQLRLEGYGGLAELTKALGPGA